MRLLAFIFCLLTAPAVNAEVCFSHSEAVDILTVLDSAERETKALSECEKLAQEIYLELTARDNQVQSLTKDLIEAKHDVISYKASAKQWRRYTLYSTAGALALLLIKFAPLL